MTNKYVLVFLPSDENIFDYIKVFFIFCQTHKKVQVMSNSNIWGGFLQDSASDALHERS